MAGKEDEIEKLDGVVARRRAAYGKILAEKGPTDPQVRRARKLVKRARRRRLKIKLGRRISAKERRSEA
jgi:hypothetical protein